MFRALIGISAVFGLAGLAHADIFVYQLPGGARIVTDHPRANRDYKLVRQSKTSKGAGTLVSSRSIQYAVTDPDAYDRLIRRMADRHKVDPVVVKAVMHVESAFNPQAVSHKGAQGLMQVMPETGQRYDQIMNRAQSAAFMMRANFGSSYIPAPAEHLFQDDWSKGPWARDWVEAMREAGMTAGCETSPLLVLSVDAIAP